MNPLQKLSQRRKPTTPDTKIADAEAQFYMGLNEKRLRFLVWLQRLRTELATEAQQQNEGTER